MSLRSVPKNSAFITSHKRRFLRLKTEVRRNRININKEITLQQFQQISCTLDCGRKSIYEIPFSDGENVRESYFFGRKYISLRVRENEIEIEIFDRSLRVENHRISVFKRKNCFLPICPAVGSNSGHLIISQAAAPVGVMDEALD